MLVKFHLRLFSVPLRTVFCDKLTSFENELHNKFEKNQIQQKF